MKEKSDEEFLQALKVVENSLLTLQFKTSSFEKKGYAYFVQFKREDCMVRFVYGPPQYEIDIIIYSSKGKFEFKDLLNIPTIAAWVNDNRYVQKNGRDLNSEMLWFVQLLKFSLPIIE